MRKGIFESSHPHQVYFEETLEQSLNHVLCELKELNILVATNTSLADSAAMQRIKNILKPQSKYVIGVKTKLELG